MRSLVHLGSHRTPTCRASGEKTVELGEDSGSRVSEHVIGFRDFILGA
jgi:hypothetical protein